jgi:predicted ATP-grasp superfamily ATP-dependent carboligase
MNLFAILNQQPIDFFYLAIDDFFDISLPQLKNFYSVSPPLLGIKLSVKNSSRLLEHPSSQKFIKDISSKSGHQVAIVPFKPSAKIAAICKTNHWLCLANPSTLNRQLEDKIKFTQICSKYNLPLIDYLILPFNQENFLAAQQKFGTSVITQTHFGWAGNSTHLFSDYQTAKNQIQPNTPTKFMPYLHGFTVLNNCCLTRLGLIQSPVALQYTGIKQLTQNPFTTVGRQWPAFIDPSISLQVQDITAVFSSCLMALNYTGFFGLDFLVTSEKVYLLECNPRLTASFSFYTQIEIKNRINPLFLFHLAELLNLKYNLDIISEQSRFSNPDIIGSELALKNTSGQTIKRIQKFTPFSTTSNPVEIPQIYLDQLLS